MLNKAQLNVFRYPEYTKLSNLWVGVTVRVWVRVRVGGSGLALGVRVRV